MKRVAWLLCFAAWTAPPLLPSARGDVYPARGILIHGTIVTMDPLGHVLKDGNVLVRAGKVAALWQGPSPPPRTYIGNPIRIDPGPGTLIFPGLINLHNHPGFDAVSLWPPPTSHVQAALGRPHGTEPYANRYQWNQKATMPPEHLRLVKGPYDRLQALNLDTEAVKYSEAKAILGGETAEEGAYGWEVDAILVRNVEAKNFDRQRIKTRVKAVGDMTDVEVEDVKGQMKTGDLDAWIIHLAEGVRDGARRPGDDVSSRAELDFLDSTGLLTDATVIVHGNGFEPTDFATMRAAKSIRSDGSGDGLGAKLVWSPLSDLLLYGQTALVYDALKAGVLVSLGTDWSPSGSRNLLDELKIADISLRDKRLLGASREELAAFGVVGKSAEEIQAAEIALDRELVRMVTTNPAQTLRWEHEVGSIAVGMFADLLVITRPARRVLATLPDSPYRDLIDATERDVRLVLVNGEALAGDLNLMEALKPGGYETVSCVRGGYKKGIDVTQSGIPKGPQKLAEIELKLGDALHTMCQSSPSVARSCEPLELTPLFIEDDDFYFHVLEADTTASGLIADDSPPFNLYHANFNQVGPAGNPFSADRYRNRYYPEMVAIQPLPGKVLAPQPQRIGPPLPPIRIKRREDGKIPDRSTP